MHGEGKLYGDASEMWVLFVGNRSIPKGKRSRKKKEKDIFFLELRGADVFKVDDERLYEGSANCAPQRQTN